MGAAVILLAKKKEQNCYAIFPRINAALFCAALFGYQKAGWQKSGLKNHGFAVPERQDHNQNHDFLDPPIFGYEKGQNKKRHKKPRHPAPSVLTFPSVEKPVGDYRDTPTQCRATFKHSVLRCRCGGGLYCPSPSPPGFPLY